MAASTSLHGSLLLLLLRLVFSSIKATQKIPLQLCTGTTALLPLSLFSSSSTELWFNTLCQMSEMIQFKMTFEVTGLISVVRYLLLRSIVCFAVSFREWYSKCDFLTVRSVPLDWGRIHSNCCHSFIYSNWFLHSWVPALMNDVFWKLGFFGFFHRFTSSPLSTENMIS